LAFLAGVFVISAYRSKNKINTNRKENWIRLFNGKDLDNWIVKIKGHPLNENYKNTFRVKEGKLYIDYDQYHDFEGAFGHIFY